MSVFALSHRGEDRDVARLDRLLNSILVHSGDLANILPLVLVEIVGNKGAADGPGSNAELVEAVGESQVLLEEELTGNA